MSGSGFVRQMRLADAHVRLARDFDLDKYLCIKAGRIIRNDNTIAYGGIIYQITSVQSPGETFKGSSLEERVEEMEFSSSKGNIRLLTK